MIPLTLAGGHFAKLALALATTAFAFDGDDFAGSGLAGALLSHDNYLLPSQAFTGVRPRKVQKPLWAILPKLFRYLTGDKTEERDVSRIQEQGVARSSSMWTLLTTPFPR